MQSQHALAAGYRLRGFQIQSILGAGGFGTAALAREGDARGPWTDIDALGATLRLALTGEGPVDGLTRAGAMPKGRKDASMPASIAGNDRCSAGFLRRSERTLAFQPEARAKTIAE